MIVVGVFPSDTSWLSEPTTGVHQFGGGSNIGFWVGGFGRSTRLMKRGLWFKPSGHSQRARRAIWTNWRTEEAISEWKHNQQQRHFSRKDRWFSHIRSAGP